MNGPKLTAIAAVDRCWGIGQSGDLLVRLPPDLKRFRELTFGHTVVMGHTTFLSLPGQKALPGRRNVVLTRNPEAICPGTETCHSLENLLHSGILSPSERVFVIGGAQVYIQLLPFCEDAYITRIESEWPDADCFFPDLDGSPGWALVESSGAEYWNDVVFRYTRYRNRQINR